MQAIGYPGQDLAAILTQKTSGSDTQSHNGEGLIPSEYGMLRGNLPRSLISTLDGVVIFEALLEGLYWLAMIAVMFVAYWVPILLSILICGLLLLVASALLGGNIK